MTARIIKMEGVFGREESKEFEKFGLKIGDEIEVNPFVGNAVSYQPEKGGDVLFIYNWNIEKVIKPCHICGDDTGKHTPDCTSYIYGITNGQVV